MYTFIKQAHITKLILVKGGLAYIYELASTFVNNMKKITSLLVLSTVFFLTTFSQKKLIIKNRFYISVADRKNEIINKVNESMPFLKSIYRLKNSDIIVFKILLSDKAIKNPFIVVKHALALHC